MAVVKLDAKVRKEIGKSASKRVRKEGYIPSVVYGQENNLNIVINQRDFIKLTHHITKSTIINLNIDGKSIEVLVKDYDKDYMTDKFIHIDFYELKKDTVAVFSIPLHFVGNPIGVREGGILVKHLTEIKVECLPKDIVNQFDIDVTNLNIGDSLHVRDLGIDKSKYKLVTHLEDVVVHVSGSEKEEVPVSAEAAGEAATAATAATTASSATAEKSEEKKA